MPIFLATMFGQLWRLEPLPDEKKLMWRREMEWLLCVSDHIVEFIPSCQTFPDGSKLEVNLTHHGSQKLEFEKHNTIAVLRRVAKPNGNPIL